jgi:adenylate cyclase
MTTARAERRLAAILAADVVGYSRLIERDERGTLERLKAHRKELVEPLLAEHRGRVVKLMGDGALCEFASIVDAVACAVAIQRGMAEREADVAEEERIRFRIGINLGDVVRDEDDDLYGDGVNIASRLEGVAEPGGIVVSGTAYDHLQGKLDCGLAPLGDQRLKNIERPVRAYRVELGAGVPITSAAASLPPPDKPAVAVLPFDNMSGDPAQAYFSGGITEDVITELSRFRELLVIARNSSFAFRGKVADVREIGRVLGAGYVVEGSVRRAGDRVRITAQLVDAATGAHLWAERYDRPLEDVFAVQDEIARGIVATVAARVIAESETAARRKPPRDVRAYDLFLQGLRLSDSFTPGTQALALELFERARALDPTFARAYTGLAFNHLNRAVDAGLGVPRGKDLDRTEALRVAEKALALDPNDPRVHFTLGYVCLTWRDFDRAERHLNMARAMNPNDAQIQIVWAWAQACLGEPERGLPAAELAIRLNPAPPPLLRALPLAHPVPRPAPRRGPDRPRAAHGRGPPRPSVGPGVAGGGLRPLRPDRGSTAVRRDVPRCGPPSVARRPGGRSDGIRGLAGRHFLPAAPRRRGAPAGGSAAGRPAGLTHLRITPVSLTVRAAWSGVGYPLLASRH